MRKKVERPVSNPEIDEDGIPLDWWKPLTHEQKIQVGIRYLKELQENPNLVPMLSEYARRCHICDATLQNHRHPTQPDGEPKYSEKKMKEIEDFNFICDRIEQLASIYNQKKLYNRDTVQGAKFWLERREGWTEKKEMKVSTEGDVKVVLGDAADFAK